MKHLDKKRLLITLLAILMGLAPLARLIRILAIAGVDVPSSDDIFFIPSVVGRVFAGGYNWTNFPRDSFQNTHVTMVPALAYLLMARFGHFNVYYALAFGVAAAAAKLAFLYDAFTFRAKPRDPLGRAALFVLLSAMIFSVTQISVFEHDFQTLKTGFTELGLAMGVWGLARFQDRWPAIVLACVGGFLASFSFANGCFLWPIFILTLVAIGSRKYLRYSVVIACSALAAAPYVYFLRINRVAGGQSQLVSLFDLRFTLSAIGRAFSNDIGSVFVPRTGEALIGALGIAALVVLSTLLWRTGRRRALLIECLPALSVAGFSLLSLLQISMFRGLVAPWYTTFAMDLWIGMAGLAYLVWSRESDGSRTRLGRVAAGVFAVVIGVLFVASNRSYSDKSFFLRTRGPAAASSLRHYLTAPTYAMDTLEIWRPADPFHFSTLGPTLDRYGLSVFGPHQEWTLQGDWILDSVDFHGAHVGWSQDMSPHFVPFTDFRHLNLFLGDGDFVSWTVELPAATSSAIFRSAAALAGATYSNSARTGRFTITAIEESGAQNLVANVSPLLRGNWTPLGFSLGRYAGRKIVLRLSYNSGDGAGGYCALRFPRIDLEQQPQPASAWQWRPQRPSNTDLSPDFSRPGPDDISLDPSDVRVWKAHDMKSADSSDSHEWIVTGPFPWLEYSGPSEIDLNKFPVFFISMQGPAEQIPDVPNNGDLYPGGIEVDFTGELGLNPDVSFQMPILYDHAEHFYSYPLWKFGLRSRITGFRLVPKYPEYGGRKVVRIQEVGFMNLASARRDGS